MRTGGRWRFEGKGNINTEDGCLSDEVIRLSVVVPAYNEQARLKRSIERMVEYFDQQDYSYEILVVSDGSVDQTEDIVRAAAKVHPAVQLLSYTPNKGKGHAVRYGILRSTGDYVLFSDADLAAPIQEIEKLWPHVLNEAEIAIGSRPLKESNLVVHQPWYREAAGRTFNLAVRLLACRGIHDTQCGFKLFRRDAARQIFSRCRLNGFSFDFESLFLAQKLGYHIAEVPIEWAHQPGSKVNLVRDGLRMLRDLVWMRFFMVVSRPAAVRYER